MTLYELTEAGRQLYDLLTADEIDEQTFTDTMESIGWQEKLEAYAKVIKNLEADAEALKAEKMRLAEKQAKAEKAVERLKSSVLAFMQATGADKSTAGVFTFSRRSSKSVVVDDLDAIPAEYIKTTYAADKAEIKKAIASGTDIAGCHIEENEGVVLK